MKKIYNLVIKIIDEDCDVEVYNFDSYEDAQKMMKSYYENYVNEDPESVIGSDIDDNSFNIAIESGRCDYEVIGKITEGEIK